MKNLFTHFISASLGAVFCIFLLIALDQVSTTFPIYIPNIFFKERIDYYVDVESAVSGAIEIANENVVGVTTYQNTQPAGTGSGVIYKLTADNAYIVTNYHVIENQTRVLIETTSGIEAEATVVGSDKITDLAVLMVPRGMINTHIEISDSEALKVGEFVIAIGNPLGLTETSTFGIVSSLNRLISIDADEDGIKDWHARVIQTDAAINPGNSGGALVNLDGKLIGINSMKIASEQVEGIGFSIPSNLVMKIIADLEAHGKVERPFLGITSVFISQLSPLRRVQYNIDVDYGLYIHQVLEDSSADVQGVKDQDVILEINGNKLQSDIDFTSIIYNAAIGDTIEMVILRNGQTITIEFELESNLD